MPRAGRVVLHRVVPFHVKISFSFSLLWRHRERLSSISEPARVGVAPEMKKKNQEKALKRIEVPPCFYSRFSATSEDTHTHTHTQTLCALRRSRGNIHSAGNAKENEAKLRLMLLFRRDLRRRKPTERERERLREKERAGRREHPFKVAARRRIEVVRKNPHLTTQQHQQ